MKLNKLWTGFRLAVAGLCALELLAGCSTRVEVESDTIWTRRVGGSVSYGEGNASFEVSRDGCWHFTKDDSAGYLRARLKHGSRPDPWNETTAPFGSVEVCSK